METDRSIIERILAGDVEAFAKLVDRYQPVCLRYAYRMLRDEDEAKDVVQETFVRAHRSLRQCRTPDNFKNWLFTILMNRCRTGLKRGKTRRKWFVRAEVCQVPDQRDEQGDASAWRMLIEQAVASLAPVYQKVLHLRFVDEMKYEEISEITGVPVSALKMRVVRGKKLLRRQLLAWRS